MVTCQTVTLREKSSGTEFIPPVAHIIITAPRGDSGAIELPALQKEPDSQPISSSRILKFFPCCGWVAGEHWRPNRPTAPTAPQQRSAFLQSRAPFLVLPSIALASRVSSGRWSWRFPWLIRPVLRCKLFKLFRCRAFKNNPMRKTRIAFFRTTLK